MGVFSEVFRSYFLYLYMGHAELIANSEEHSSTVAGLPLRHICSCHHQHIIFLKVCHKLAF